MAAEGSSKAPVEVADLIDLGEHVDTGPGTEAQLSKPSSSSSSEPEAAGVSKHLHLDSSTGGGQPNNHEPQSNEPQNHEAQHPTAEAMDSSVATLKAVVPSPISPTHHHQFLSVSDPSAPYIDPTPATPMTSQPPSRSSSAAAVPRSPSSPSLGPGHARALSDDSGYDEKRFYPSEDEASAAEMGAVASRGKAVDGGGSEIQSIMDQFTGDGGGPGEDEVMSPRLEIAAPMLGGPLTHQHPPRKSSLEPLALAHQLGSDDGAALQGLAGLRISDRGGPSSPSGNRPTRSASADDSGPPVPPKDRPSPAGKAKEEMGQQQDEHEDTAPLSPTVSLQHRPPPPEPEPEPALPFDFHRFLEQLRNKKADPVARYLKSFLSEFGKRQWMVHEQVKIISDFLAFISDKMAQCDVWSSVSDAEFDNAREGMEKLVMNRLYTQTFSPAIPAPQPIPGAKPKRRGAEKPMGPGRRGQHQEDVERDDILAQKIAIYGWVREEHLDIPPVSEHGRRFLKLAQQELLKIRTYRAPRDKIICVLNCCKVIFGLLRHSKSDSSADSFMPLLIYVVLHSNPDHLVSNVQYILRFRNQEKLGGEAGYYLSSLMGAVQFIENMDRTTLTITDDEFETNVEAAVSAIAEKHRLAAPPPAQDAGPSSSSSSQPAVEKSATPLPPASGLPLPPTTSTAQAEASSSAARRSLEAVLPTSGTGTPPPRRSGDGGDRPTPSSAQGAGDEQAPIANLLRSIQKPLSTIGRIFSDEPLPSSAAAAAAARPRSVSPGANRSPSRDDDAGEQAQQPQAPRPSGGGAAPLSAEEAAARQASAEAAEAQRLSRAEHANVVETLAGMFPDLDRDLISDVVYQKQGRVGLAVDACLALSA